MHPLLTKLAQARWSDIGPIIFLFGVLMDLDFANISHEDPWMSVVSPTRPWSIHTHRSRFAYNSNRRH